MKLSSFAATIAISLLSTTEGLQNNLRSVVPSISTAASSSSTADDQKHASSTIRGAPTRSAAASAATPSNDIQRHAQAVDDGYYYPSWNTGEHTCKNDGNAPNYMKTDGGYHESTLKDCCERYYSYDIHTCMGSNPMDIEGFYPAWGSDANEIKCMSMSATDTLPPAYMLSNPTAWIDSNIETCCSRRYSWATATCISASLEAAGSSAPVSSPATAACVGECYTFDSQEGKMTVTDPVNGGCNSGAMCVMTLESLTNPTPPAGSVTAPTGSPTNDELATTTQATTTQVATTTQSTPIPSHSPSHSPSKEPTQGPSQSPSKSPSKGPSMSPSKGPSISPTTSPTPLPCPADGTLTVGETCSTSCPNSCQVGLGCKNSQCLTIDWIRLGGDIDGTSFNAQFGRSVSLSSDGKTLAIGAWLNNDLGHVRVYKRDETKPLGWTQLGGDIDGEASQDYLGYSVSLSSDGNTLAIGAMGYGGNSESGYARVYKRDETESLGWIQLGGDIDGEGYRDASGSSVSLSSDGKTVAIGAKFNGGNGSRSGHVRVYERDENQTLGWIQLGDDIDGAAAGDVFGWSVSLSSDGKTIAIGAIGTDQYTGQVRVYKRDETKPLGWTQLGGDIDGEASQDYLGVTVSLSSDGKTVAIGAPGNDEIGSDSGQVRVYKIDDLDNWIKVGDDIDGEAADDGKILAIGAPGNSNAPTGANGIYSGHTRVYKVDNSDNWIKLLDIEGEAAGDWSGGSVSLSSDGKTVAIGAPKNENDLSKTDHGHVRVYEVAA